MRLKQLLVATTSAIVITSFSSVAFAGAVTSKEEIAISTTGGGIKVKSDNGNTFNLGGRIMYCLLYTSPSPRDATLSRMPSSA